jgi:photosystem II stability/assembly factor-like uncharacterized protein
MRYLFLAAVCSVFSIPAKSQNTPDQQLIANMHIRSIGPAGMSGRVTAIDAVRHNPNTIVIGSASGGAWRSDDGGIGWKPLFDAQPVSSIGAIAIQQNNPDVIWAGTGEGNPRNSHNSGDGIYKSIDGGRTWTKMGLEKTRTIHRIVIHRDNPEIVFVAAHGSAWGPSEERGVYKTMNGGKTWERILYTNNTSGCAELVADPANPDKYYAAMWDYERKPWTFRSGGPGSGLYITLDGGKTWSKRTDKDGLPAGELGRIGIAVARSKPNMVYAIVESKTIDLYKSTDGGYRWAKVSSERNLGNRPFYYNEIHCDPKNENRLYSLWSQVSRSEDGGRTWQILMNWNHVHPDHHAMYIHPDNPDFMINGNDGGLNISYDGGKSWRFAENLPLGQFYHVRIDQQTPYKVYGGMQDNGSWVGPGYVRQHGGIRNSHWQEVYFGDGFDVAPVSPDGDTGYAMSQGGNLALYNLKTGNTYSIKPVHPQGVKLRFNWNAALATDPFNTNGVYYGSQFVHYSADRGKTWRIISPDLTSNDPSKQKQAESGGLTIDATDAENHCTILAIAPDANDRQVIWVGTDDGRLQLTRDGGKNWVNLIGRMPGAPAGAWIPFIQTGRRPGTAWVVINNYRLNDWEPYLYYTADFGQTWKRMADGKKVSGHCLSVCQDPIEEKLVFLGTEQGLWVSFDAGNTWTKWNKQFPSVPVSDLQLQTRENDLVIATFGRAIWILDDISPLREYVRRGRSVFDKNMVLFPVQDAWQAGYNRPAGMRFPADAWYEGENKRYGAALNFWVKRSGSGSEKLAISGEVYDATGKKIRTHRLKLDSGGFYRIYWRMISDGIRFPAHETPGADSDLPEGPTVPPGKYKLVLRYGAHADSSWCTVLADPRNPFNAAAYNATMAAYRDFTPVVARATRAFDALNKAEGTLDALKEAYKHAPDSVIKKIESWSKPVRDSIANLKLLYMLPRDYRAYEFATIRLNNYLYEAFNYLMNSESGPGSNAGDAARIAKIETDKVCERINRFFDREWAAFRNNIEALPNSTFPLIEKL